MKILLLLNIISSVLELIQSANILVTIAAPFYSHQSTFRPLWRELSRRGHKITLFTTDLMEQNENITQIDYSSAYKIKNIQFKNDGILQKINKIMETLDEISVEQLTHPYLINLLRSEEKFDLIFSEIMNPMLPVFVTKFHCPFISIYSLDPPAYLHALMGNAMHPAIYAYPILDYQIEFSFKDRLINTLIVSIIQFTKEIMFLPIEKYYEKYIGQQFPSVFDVEKNASLIIINANPIFYPPRAVTPVTINIAGGIHLSEPRSLPQDLQTYLDESKHGCIYFSFGTTVDSNYLSSEKLEIFRETFEELAPIRVLWKFANETMAFKPSNVKLRKWLPQHDILRHPNVKLFITQGGLQSMEEAIDSAVPMLGIPFYGDQLINVKKMVDKEFGLSLDLKTMDDKSLKKSILELINNPKYKKNIDRLSAITKDQPMRPLEKAVWWTEYVLRHGTTEHLRSPSADIPLYQYFFLDIMAFLFVVFIFILLFIFYTFKLIRWIFRLISSKKNKVKTN